MRPLLISFVISVAAGLTCHYLCKWLDGNRQKGNQPKE